MTAPAVPAPGKYQPDAQRPAGEDGAGVQLDAPGRMIGRDGSVHDQRGNGGNRQSRRIEENVELPRAPAQAG